MPSVGIEVGPFYKRILKHQRMTYFGTLVYLPPSGLLLQVKGEWAHSVSGHGYWIQGGYRLSQFGGPNSAIGRLEPVFRMQQFFRSRLIAGDSLPSTNVRRPEFGLNYYLPREVRLNASYGRQFISQSTDVNVWEFGITYRFLFPLLPGGSKLDTGYSFQLL